MYLKEKNLPFEKGNKLGRKKGTKNLLPLIRERVLKALDRRIAIDKTLASIETADLLKFAQSIMPKDISIKVAPDIQYISSTPRPINTIDTHTIAASNDITHEGDTLLVDTTRPSETAPISSATNNVVSSAGLTLHTNGVLDEVVDTTTDDDTSEANH